VLQKRTKGLTGGESDLVRDLYPNLRRYAAVVAPLDMEPDDLVQEALVRTLRLHRLNELDYAPAYLWKVMCSLATDHRRSAARRRLAMRRLGRPEPRNDAYPSDLADLEVLSPQARAVLYLHEIEGFRFREVAQILDAKESSMRRTATRARRSLRRVLDEEVADATA
jgi:RNA polymerase sigma-70 factor (ECF subfamily)